MNNENNLPHVDGSTSRTVLHFTRARARGDSSFYDPQADIRVIFPTAVKATLTLLSDAVKSDGAKKEFEYLAKCYYIFQIRIVEDPSDLVQQILDFENAIKKVRPVHRWIWQQALFTLLNCLYALFTRRDAQTDGKEIRGMLNTAQQASLLQVLDKEQQAQIHAAFFRLGADYTEDAVTNPNGKVVCEETERVIENIKDIAQIFISHHGPSDWHSLAKACDEYFKTADVDKLPEDQQTAIALAYPDYDTPYLTVEKTDD